MHCTKCMSFHILYKMCVSENCLHLIIRLHNSIQLWNVYNLILKRNIFYVQLIYCSFISFHSVRFNNKLLYLWHLIWQKICWQKMNEYIVISRLYSNIVHWLWYEYFVQWSIKFDIFIVVLDTQKDCAHNFLLLLLWIISDYSTVYSIGFNNNNRILKWAIKNFS